MVAKPALKGRLESKQFFLTYPRCYTSPHLFRENLNKSYECTKGIVAREFHADGTPHLHVWFELKQQLRTRNMRVFDTLVEGVDDDFYYPPKHPNIVTKIRSQLEVAKYILKDQYPRQSTEWSKHSRILAFFLVTFPKEGKTLPIEINWDELKLEGFGDWSIDLTFEDEDPRGVRVTTTVTTDDEQDVDIES